MTTPTDPSDPSASDPAAAAVPCPATPAIPAPPAPTPPSSSAQPPPLDPVLAGNPDLKTLFEALLRRPHALIPRLGGPGVMAKFVMIALLSFLLFGVVLGCFAKHEQLWAAPAKLAAGLLISGIICFPSLYIFATLAGARVNPSQLASALAGALALAGLLLLGFAPAVWIFAESTDSFGFMGFLGLGAWLIALVFALRFLKTLVVATGGSQFGPMVVWSIVFLLVTLQMTTSLRPILGRSDSLLTQEKKFFLQHWGDYAGRSLGDPKAADSGKNTRPSPDLPQRAVPKNQPNPVNE